MPSYLNHLVCVTEADVRISTNKQIRSGLQFRVKGKNVLCRETLIEPFRRLKGLNMTRIVYAQAQIEA